MRTFLELKPEAYPDRIFILDLDGTIVPDKSAQFSPAIINQLKAFKAVSETIICSNGSPANAQKLAQLSGVTALPGRKPWRGVLNKFANQSVAVVGDKYLTDGLLAKNLGGEFIKVRRLIASTDSFFTRFSYTLDDLVWFFVPAVKILRPTQWVKNLLVFAPLFFAAGLKQSTLVVDSLAAFVIFSLAASVVYVINDLIDQGTDRSHPRKKFRPLPAGRLSSLQAGMILLALVVLLIALLIKWPALWLVISIYLLLNLIYTGWLKHVVVADVVVVALCYVLRVVAGGVITGLFLSNWILLCTFFGALLVITGKRRAEFEQTGRRPVLNHYSKTTLDLILISSAVLAVITYSIWTIWVPHNYLLVYSSLLVAATVWRLLQQIYSEPLQAETPEALVFKDPWILGTFLTWVAFVFLVFYLV